MERQPLSHSPSSKRTEDLWEVLWDPRVRLWVHLNSLGERPSGKTPYLLTPGALKHGVAVLALRSDNGGDGVRAIADLCTGSCCYDIVAESYATAPPLLPRFSGATVSPHPLQ